MAVLSFPKAQLGGFTTEITGIRYHVLGYNEQYTIQDVTGSSAAGVPDTSKRFCYGIPTFALSAQGNVEDSSGDCAKGQASTLQLGTHLVHVNQWVVGKRWELFNVTGTSGGNADQQAGFISGLPLYFLSAQGHVLGSGPKLGTASQSVTADLNQFGALAGTAVTRTTQLQVPLNRGGPIGYQITVMFSGSVTYTGTAFSSTFGHAVVSAPRGDASLDLDTGETISGKFFANELRVRVNNRDGGALLATVQFTKDQDDPEN